MQKYTTEMDARIVIDDQLKQASWDPSDKSQVLTEYSLGSSRSIISDKKSEGIASYSVRISDSDQSKLSRVDYLLLDQQGRALAVIEAKRNAIHPYAAKQQALPYAKRLGAPFIFLTNGDLIYFWDYLNDDARIVNSFYSRRDLERLVYMRRERKPLATIPIPEYYLCSGEQRQFRPYQQEAMKAMDHALELGKRRFLIELPTGTGKTDLTILYLQRLIKAGRAERILFLVDREQLAKQALNTILDLMGQYPSYWLQPGMARQEKQVTVCLLQTMISRYQEYSSGYFDVVVSDECHRSIYGAWQTALTHFDALHIGLTATPAAYIERNTFRFYNCKDNTPDFSYPIINAFQAGYLVPYKFATGITEIIAEGADVNDEHYDPAEFERKWTNEDTNRKMVEEFDKLAWDNYQNLSPGQPIGPGKTIFFAITKHHAARLAEYLNQLHPVHHGNYAAVITSDVLEADDLIRKFKYEDYPQIAVSVGMLDTGFNCREVLHLVMCRRVRSPILYQQMRGRGTRTAPHIQKQKFVIYDFFGNHKYFNDSDTDIFVGAGAGHISAMPPKHRPFGQGELIELGLEDEWLEKVSYIEVGPEGERVDKRVYVYNWKQTIQRAVKDDPILIKIRNNEPLTEDEEAEIARRLNSPKMYYNEDNLRRAYQRPDQTMIDFIRAALGNLKIKSREEMLTDNFYAWLVAKNLNPEQANYLSLLKNRGIVKGKIDINDLFQPPLSIVNAAEVGLELFGEKGLKEILTEMNEMVFMKQSA